MKRQRFFRREDLGCKLQNPKHQESSPAEHLCEVKPCSCTVTELLQSNAEPGPPWRVFRSNQRNPHPTHRNLKTDATSGCERLFGNLLCVLSQCYNTSTTASAGSQLEPFWGAGGGERRACSWPCLYFKEAGANEDCLSCAGFSPECHGGRWQPAAL